MLSLFGFGMTMSCSYLSLFGMTCFMFLFVVVLYVPCNFKAKGGSFPFLWLLEIWLLCFVLGVQIGSIVFSLGIIVVCAFLQIWAECVILALYCSVISAFCVKLSCVQHFVLCVCSILILLYFRNLFSLDSHLNCTRYIVIVMCIYVTAYLLP